MEPGGPSDIDGEAREGERAARANQAPLPVHTRIRLTRQPPKQKCSKHDEEDVRHPDQEFRVDFRISAERVGDNDEKEISHGHDQSNREADRRFAAVRGEAERHADDGKRDTGEWK
jgi:hypothetical protein